MWAAVVFCGIALAASYTGTLGLTTSRVLAGIVQALLLATLAMAFLWGYREGLRRAKGSTEIERIGDTLIQRTEGWPDKRIAMSEVTTVSENRDWLVVKSVSTTISIPREVAGFQELKDEITSHRSLIPPSFPALPLVRLVLFVAGWALLMLSSQVWVVLGAGIVVLAIQAGAFFEMAPKLKAGPKGHFARFVVLSVVGWGIVIWLLRYRLTTLGWTL